MYQELGIEFRPLLSIDPKEAASVFCNNNLRAEHHYMFLDEFWNKKTPYCVVHGRTCGMTKAKLNMIDLFVAGFPCAPFSAFRTTQARQYSATSLCKFLGRFGPPQVIERTHGLTGVLRFSSPVIYSAEPDSWALDSRGPSRMSCRTKRQPRRPILGHPPANEKPSRSRLGHLNLEF